MAQAEPAPEPRLNRLLRLVDWRFLLRQRETPRVLDLSGGSVSEALRLVTQPAADGSADLAVLGYPDREGLKVAREGLRRGGEAVCLWRTPRLGSPWRARARLRRAGFSEVRLYWPYRGPDGGTELWLPLDAPAATARVLSQRPPRSRWEALLRRAWRLAALTGRLTPTCAVARLKDGGAANPASVEDAASPTSTEAGRADAGDEIDALLPAPEPWVLLTGGEESDSKVVGLPCAGGASGPAVVVKFARLAKADAALEREAEVLRGLERERPDLAGVPRLRASGRRAGQRAIAQDAVRGRPLSATLDSASFAAAAPAVTRWLLALAGEPALQPASAWFERLVSGPLDELEQDFGDLLPAGTVGRARRALADLGDLPLVYEHRDFGPWNISLEECGEPMVIDWEDAEPQGLPGLDLAYFLASFAFAADGALDDDRRRVNLVRDSYRRLLDPSTELGAVAAACFDEYRAALGIDPGDFRRLRLLCWLLQALIAYRRLRDHGAAIASGEDFFIWLAEDELLQLESST